MAGESMVDPAKQGGSGLENHNITKAEYAQFLYRLGYYLEEYYDFEIPDLLAEVEGQGIIYYKDGDGYLFLDVDGGGYFNITTDDENGNLLPLEAIEKKIEDNLSEEATRRAFLFTTAFAFLQIGALVATSLGVGDGLPVLTQFYEQVSTGSPIESVIIIMVLINAIILADMFLFAAAKTIDHAKLKQRELKKAHKLAQKAYPKIIKIRATKEQQSVAAIEEDKAILDIAFKNLSSQTGAAGPDDESHDQGNGGDIQGRLKFES